MSQHGALQEQLPACLILSEYQESDNCTSVYCVHMRRLLPRLFVRRLVQALCYEMRHILCAMKCAKDFELGELLAVEVVGMPSGERIRRWNSCVFGAAI
ncbi:hypothetical protein AVEN_239496-1 [Araneus ventricosus]|uniref:Uncharacterized protein n=1 Tax=Araneus ventricosus TaxID=182803 RepID=A0A4Y2IK55_ARAVE|nr:hypothetical protein AVEN_239496-1 [Araneus ventricosus]